MGFFKHFHNHFGWLFWGLIILGFVWFFTGGLLRDSSHEGLYLKPPAPLDSGQVYGKYYAGPTGTSTQKEKLDIPQWPGNFVVGIIHGIQFVIKTVEGN